MTYAIAIDGPAGAGKSTLARMLAKRLGYLYVDTGALYRAIGYFMLSKKLDIHDEESITAALQDLTVTLAHTDGEQHVFVNGEDVNDRIRTPEISMAASGVSAIGAVRAFLLKSQRELADTHSVIMDGRDIGTTILPHATVKIFLTASAESRAKRRVADLQAKGNDTPYEQVLEDMKKRDYDDSHRAISPLSKAVDAIEVDTSNDTPDESVERLMTIIRQKIAI